MVSELKSDIWLAFVIVFLVVNYETVVYYTLEVYNYQILGNSTFESKYYKNVESIIDYLKLTDTLKEKYLKY